MLLLCNEFKILDIDQCMNLLAICSKVYYMYTSCNKLYAITHRMESNQCPHHIESPLLG